MESWEANKSTDPSDEEVGRLLEATMPTHSPGILRQNAIYIPSAEELGRGCSLEATMNCFKNNKSV
jgi:hypothetical protein